MEGYSKAMDTFANVHTIVAFIWGPMKLLLELSRSHADAFNGILEVRIPIGETTPSFLRQSFEP